MSKPAVQHLVDADLIPKKFAPRLSREMRMESSIDRLPVTMDNLHEIQQLREEEAQAKQAIKD